MNLNDEIQAIKSYLKAHKISYIQLAEKSGMALNTLKNIFSGRTPNPRLDTMQAIENALGLNDPATEDDFPVSFENFELMTKNKERLAKIASLPIEKQRVLFEAIDALIKGMEEK